MAGVPSEKKRRGFGGHSGCVKCRDCSSLANQKALSRNPPQYLPDAPDAAKRLDASAQAEFPPPESAAEGKAQNIAPQLKGDRKAAAKGIWPVTYKWVAMGTLVAYTAIGGQKIALAIPQQKRVPIIRSQPQTRNSPLTARYRIQPARLGDVLQAFESASGLKVTLENRRICEIQSPGVAGVYTSDEALDRLLAGTGVTYRFTGPNSVNLELETVQQSVTVKSYPLNVDQDQVASAKYTAPILDTPQSINVVPRQVMSEQNTTTLRDALRNVSGISLAAGEGSSQGDNLTIRGFSARNDIFLDGMRDFGSYYRDTFDQQEVQVLEGPSAITFGRGTTGGVVNEVSKSPEMVPFIRGNATAGNDLTRRVELDMNELVPELGSGAFRLNVMGDDNKVADRDVAEYRRYGFAPSLALGLGTTTRAIFSYFHQSEEDAPDYGIPWLFNRPAPVPRSNYYGFQDANFLRTNDDIITAKVEHDFSSGITLRNTLRYYHEGRGAQITEPQITACPVQPSAPTPGCAALDTPLDQIVVTRNQITADSVETSLDDQLDVTLRFGTGGVRHVLVAGLEGIRGTSDPTRGTTTGVPTTSLLDPDESQLYAGTTVPRSEVQVTALTLGAYAMDTMELGRKFDLIAGGRWDDFDADYHEFISNSAFTQVVGLPSWRGALVYKPTPNSSIYFDAGNSYNPSAETLSLSAADANTPPEESLTFEAGTKWDLLSGRLAANGSVFRTDMTNAREPDPNDPLEDVLGGHERVNGFQLSVTGNLTDRWQLLASYALLASEVVSSKYYPQSVGAELANVPRNTFDFWSVYRSPWKNVQFGFGGNFVDRRTASSTVPYVAVPTGLSSPATINLLQEVPGYWAFNAMIRYPLGERTSLQVNLDNLTNNYYYDEIHPGHIVPGSGFTALMGINFRF